MTIEILRETSIGATVYETKKKFPVDHGIHISSKNLISEWKQIRDLSKGSVAVTTNDSKPAKVSKSYPDKSTPSSANSAVGVDEIDDDADDCGVEEIYNSLPPGRMKVTD